MTKLYGTYLEGLAAAGVSRLWHFSSIGPYSKYGSWGLTESQDQDPRDAPKLQVWYRQYDVTCSTAGQRAE